MDVASSSRQQAPSAASHSSWRRSGSSRPRNIDTGGYASSPQKGQLPQDDDSVASSPISTHSNDSIDTEGLSEDDRLMHQSRHYQEERGDPPPAYSPSAPNTTSGPLASDRVPSRTNHQATYGSTGEARVYYTFPHAAPTTPGEVDSDPSEPLFGRRRQWKRRDCRFCCYPCNCSRLAKKRLCLLLSTTTGILLVLVILWQAFQWIHDAYSKEPDLIPWFSCDNAEVERSESFDFHDFSTFSLEEQLPDQFKLTGSVGGKIQIVESGHEQDAAVRVNVDMRSTYLTFLQKINFEPSINKLSIKSPSSLGNIDRLQRERACTAINIVISVNRKLATSLTVNTFRLTGVEFDHNLALSPRDLTIRTVVGDIAKRPGSVERFIPGHIYLHTIAGAIRGAFPLVSDTWLGTVSGLIDVAVAIPSRGSTRLDSAAYLHANTESGAVHISFPTHLRPAPTALQTPEYFVQASAVSGRVSGTFLHDAETNLTTVSGDINAVILPWARTRGAVSSIQTKTVFGQTDLTVGDIEPSSGLIEPMRTTHSRHESVAGGMRLRYPEGWEGTVRGEWAPPFGKIDIAGPGVEIVTSGAGNVEARRGDSGGSGMEVETVSGVCEVLIGVG